MEKKNKANKLEMEAAAKRGKWLRGESYDYETKVKLYKHKSRQAQ